MSGKKTSTKNAVLLTTATESTLLRPYVESLSLSPGAKAAVFAVGAPGDLDKLKAALPSSLAAADLDALSDITATLGGALSRATLLAHGFAVCALDGGLEEAVRKATSLKLTVRTAADFDALSRDEAEVEAFTLAAELVDTAGAQKKLAALPPARRHDLLRNVFHFVSGPESQRRLVRVCDGLDVGVELASRILESLPEDGDVRPFARYEETFRTETFKAKRNEKETLDLWLFLPTPYYRFVRRLAKLGAPFVEHTSTAARAVIVGHNTGINEAFLQAAEDIVGDRDFVLNKIFQLWVWQNQPDFLLVSPDLPGHPAYCSCAECGAFRVQGATRRIVALAPFDALSNETKELVKKVMGFKRSQALLPILAEWAPSLASPAAKGAKGAKPKPSKAATTPPTPQLDRAEAWLVKLQAAKTPAALKKLEAELDTIESTDLIDEDATRWEELIQSVTDHRDTFAHGTKQNETLQRMVDALSST